MYICDIVLIFETYMYTGADPHHATSNIFFSNFTSFCNAYYFFKEKKERGWGGLGGEYIDNTYIYVDDELTLMESDD